MALARTCRHSRWAHQPPSPSCPAPLLAPDSLFHSPSICLPHLPFAAPPSVPPSSLHQCPESSFPTPPLPRVLPPAPVLASPSPQRGRKVLKPRVGNLPRLWSCTPAPTALRMLRLLLLPGAAAAGAAPGGRPGDPGG